MARSSSAPPMGFSRHKIPRSSAYTISEKAIRFRHPDYDPDRAQKLISSSTCPDICRHATFHPNVMCRRSYSRGLHNRKTYANANAKSRHAFLSNLANRQTDRQTDNRQLTRAKTCTSSFVRGNKLAYFNQYIT